MNITVSRGIPVELHEHAAQLYDIAFGEKLALAIPGNAERLKILSSGMQLQFSFGAFKNQNLVGLAGFTTSDGSLTGGINYRGLLSELGWLKGHRAAAVLAFYERTPKAGELLMDGIVVDPAQRGNGIGTRIFANLIDYARSENYSTIRLDVIDTNPAARRLYERLGFQEEHTEQFEILRRVLGFGAATTMIYKVK